MPRPCGRVLLYSSSSLAVNMMPCVFTHTYFLFKLTLKAWGLFMWKGVGFVWVDGHVTATRKLWIFNMAVSDFTPRLHQSESVKSLSLPLWRARWRPRALRYHRQHWAPPWIRTRTPSIPAKSHSVSLPRIKVIPENMNRWQRRSPRVTKPLAINSVDNELTNIQPGVFRMGGTRCISHAIGCCVMAVSLSFARTRVSVQNEITSRTLHTELKRTLTLLCCVAGIVRSWRKLFS